MHASTRKMEASMETRHSSELSSDLAAPCPGAWMSMTYSELISRKARLLIRLSGFIALPSIIACLVAWYGGDEKNSFVVWCKAYWWLVLAGSYISYLFAAVIMSFLMRCPLCNFRFARAGINRITLGYDTSVLQYCPKCGGSFKQTVNH